MTTQRVQFVDPSHNIVAVAQVFDEGDQFGGTVDVRPMPGPLRDLFEEFEEIVNGQMFVFLDAIEEKIASLSIRALFADGCEATVEKLQVFPSTGECSFRLTGFLKGPCRVA